MKLVISELQPQKNWVMLMTLHPYKTVFLIKQKYKIPKSIAYSRLFYHSLYNVNNLNTCHVKSHYIDEPF